MNWGRLTFWHRVVTRILKALRPLVTYDRARRLPQCFATTITLSLSKHHPFPTQSVNRARPRACAALQRAPVTTRLAASCSIQVATAQCTSSSGSVVAMSAASTASAAACADSGAAVMARATRRRRCSASCACQTPCPARHPANEHIARILIYPKCYSRMLQAAPPAPPPTQPCPQLQSLTPCSVAASCARNSYCQARRLQVSRASQDPTLMHC